MSELPSQARIHTATKRPTWPALDGLRGIAVSVVVLFHGAFGWASNGYVGVDVFFVLSGFLITWLLIDERVRTGHIDLVAFYLRRARRLYPALAVTVLGLIALGIISGRLNAVLPGAIAALIYLANWWIYTGHDAPLLDHTWTLSIEEHYYLAWPILLAMLGARRIQWRVVSALLILILGIAVITSWPSALDSVRGSYVRGVSIVYGSILAAILVRRGRPARRKPLGVASFVALIGILTLSLIPGRLPEPLLTGVGSIPSLLTLVVVAASVLAPDTLPSRLLGWHPLRWVGRRAYGIYLYHFPIMSLMVHQLDLGLAVWLRALLGIMLSLAAAAASYEWVELPFLRINARLAKGISPGAPTTDHEPSITTISSCVDLQQEEVWPSPAEKRRL